MRLTYHLTPREWFEASAPNAALGAPSLAGEGFIHFADVDQVVGVANRAFRGERDLVLLCVSPERLTADVKREYAEDAGEAFPHLYGALNLDAVVQVVALSEGPDGFELPAQARAAQP